MSTGFECEFVEVEPDRWYYVLQNWDCPVGAWNWREYATAYGPFGSFEGARDHLHNNHANPGGYSIHQYTEGYEPDEIMTNLISAAR